MRTFPAMVSIPEHDPEGQKVHHFGLSLLWGDFFYSPATDKLWHIKMEELTVDNFKNFSTPRMEEMKEMAKIRIARESVTPDQLKKLGLL
jgi:hypothetical protein